MGTTPLVSNGTASHVPLSCLATIAGSDPPDLVAATIVPTVTPLNAITFKPGMPAVAGPGSPLAPCGPAGPAGPTAPGGPACPIGPAVPAGPAMPEPPPIVTMKRASSS